MTDNERTFVTFATTHQRRCRSHARLRADGPVLWIECSVCHAMLKLTLPDAGAMAVMLDHITGECATRTVQ